MRTLDFLWCSDPVGYKHRRLGHTSRIHAWGFQGLFGMLSCLLSEKPCLLHLAEVYRNSWLRLIVRATNQPPPLNLRYVINPNFFDFRISSSSSASSSSASSSSSTFSGGRLANGQSSLKEVHYRHQLGWQGPLLLLLLMDWQHCHQVVNLRISLYSSMLSRSYSVNPCLYLLSNCIIIIGDGLFCLYVCFNKIKCHD